jgi:imidazolonepropionase-like amidohydrolase
MIVGIFARGAALLFALFAGSANAAEAELATAPKGAKSWTIVSAGGSHGEEQVWTDKDGVRWARMHILLRGLVYDVDQALTPGAGMIPQTLVIRGVTPEGDASERFSIDNGVATWKSPVDAGAAPWRDGLVYIPFGGPIDSFAVVANALLADDDKMLDALPGGAVRLEDLTTHTVKIGKKSKALKAVTIEGVDFTPTVLWLDDKNEFFAYAGVLSWMPTGWEGAAPELVEAQDAALAERAPALRARIMTDPGAPVLFRNVTIYDGATNGFKKGMSVLVEGSTIAAVGKKGKVKAPDGAQIIEGKGKTLMPGLFDMHHHYGDDGQGPLDLAQGVTSVRDVGNDRKALLARKKRIDDGALLGPKIYPVLGIDGDGPLSAQSFVRVHSAEEGIEAVRAAKADGFFGVKLYGTINPDWVAPMADEAHTLGLSVQGHIPAGMRPSEAVAAGYDGINHINFIVMEAMPNDVVATSNGLNRFFGPGRYAKDIDLAAPPMAPFLATLAEKKIVVDPTLTVYEISFVPNQGEVAPGFAPWAGLVPPQVERAFKAGGLVAPEGYDATRDDMRASFRKLVDTVRRLHELGVPIVAGTDGLPTDLIRELELYVEAGMTIGEAIETATDGAASVLGVGDTVGSIAAGQTADLFLADGDVSKNLNALRRVETVVQGGKMMDAQALREAVGITGMPAL